jgi:hypothetical protein
VDARGAAGAHLPAALNRPLVGRLGGQMPQPRRRLPSPRNVPWKELRRRSTVVFLILQAGWSALTSEERREVRRLVSKSRGRPRNLTKLEARQLGKLVGKAARGAAFRRRR